MTEHVAIQDRGEYQFNASGKKWIARLSYEALAVIKDEFGDGDFFAASQKVDKALSTNDPVMLSRILQIALKEHHGEVALDDIYMPMLSLAAHVARVYGLALTGDAELFNAVTELEAVEKRPFFKRIALLLKLAK